MHYRLLVTIALPTDWTSEQVRRTVYKRLARRKWFWRGGDRYGVPLCDWFVIGGRWTGLLAEVAMSSRYRRALHKRFPELTQNCWEYSIVEQNINELDLLWQRYGGKGPSRFTRSTFENYGYADDAMIVSKKLYDRLLLPYAGISYDPEAYMDLDNEVLGPSIVGHKWLVLIDYHS
jgi:hypothetical protein